MEEKNRVSRGVSINDLHLTYDVPHISRVVDIHLDNEVSKDNLLIGKVSIKCPKAMGHTIGFAIRREILTSTRGFGVCLLSINGARSLFDSLPGIRESIMYDIVFNLKKLSIIYEGKGSNTVEEEYMLGASTTDSSNDNYDNFGTEGITPVMLNTKDDEENVEMNRIVSATLEIDSQGEGRTIQAKDFQMPSGYKILNPEQIICTLDANSSINMSIGITKGYGFVKSTDMTFSSKLEPHFMSLDTNFSPITSIVYNVSKSTGGSKEFDQVEFEIETNGSIGAKDVVQDAAKRLCNVFNDLTSDGNSALQQEEKIEDKWRQSSITALFEGCEDKIKNTDSIIAKLSIQGIQTIEDLIQKSRDDLKIIPGIGETTLDKIKFTLNYHGFELK